MTVTVATLFTLVTASVTAMAFAYSALSSQRWWRRPVRQFPAHVTAILAAMVALRAWMEVLGALHGGLAWLSTLFVPLTVLLLADTRIMRLRDDSAVQRGIETGATFQY